MFLKQTNQLNIWLQLLKEYWITKKYLSHKKTPLPPRTPSFKIKFRSHHYCSLNLFKFTWNCVSSCSPFSSRFYYSNKLLISSLICFEFANMYHWLIQFFHIDKYHFFMRPSVAKAGVFWNFYTFLIVLNLFRSKFFPSHFSLITYVPLVIFIRLKFNWSYDPLY